MRTTHFFALLLAMALAGCREEPKPTPPPEPPPVQPDPKGTSIKVGEVGVEVESREGDVKVSPDSVSIELPPKK